MQRVAWLTDVHLDHLDDDAVAAFCRQVAETGARAVLIGGDIATAPTLARTLEILVTHLQRPIYFVCGNHDYYHGSIAAVRDLLRQVTRETDQLCWLPACGCVALGEHTGLVGHGCWNDGRLGNYADSTVMLTDYVIIAELAWLDPKPRLAKLNELGDEAAAHLAEVVPRALARFEHLVVLTHVPPFREACCYQGEISTDDWLPHFTCKAAGDVLLSAMQRHPQRTMTVLCGHTHGAGLVDILPNLQVKTGAAVYGKPQVQELIEVD